MSNTTDSLSMPKASLEFGSAIKPKRTWVARLIAFLKTLGVTDQDSERDKSQKFMLVCLAGLMSLGGIVWGTILLVFGMYEQALIPLGYVVISVINIGAFHITGRFKLAQHIQIAFSLLLPFALQWWLGGFMASGAVLLWSPMALLAAIILQRGAHMVRWILAFIGLTILSGVIDPMVRAHRPEIITDEVSLFMLVLNIVAMVGLITGLSMSNLQRDKKMRKTLYATMDELEQSKEEIEAQSELVMEKSKEIENQNRKTTDSIRYAKRIQQAILPARKEMCSVFSESFVYFQPKDIVSGDFYWCSQLEDCMVVVAADCTGHGVSGAMMTMLGSSILNQVVNDEGITDPADILKRLDTRLEKTLKQDAAGNTRVADGMDISVVVLYPDMLQLKFAGAKANLYVVRDGEMNELKGDRFPVGQNEKYGDKQWVTQVLNYQKGDTFYMASDGYKDQFGGPDNTKYLAKNFRDTLIELSELALDRQEEILGEKFDAWKGSRPQTDDVLVMGMRI